MISEYLDNVRGRLHDALRDGLPDEVKRLQGLMSTLMIDADKTGEKMPWDKVCPACGAAISCRTR